MDLGQAQDGKLDPNAVIVDELRARVDEMRRNGIGGVAFIDTIVEFALRQFFDPQSVIKMGHEVVDLSQPIGYRDGEAWGHGLIGMGN